MMLRGAWLGCVALCLTVACGSGDDSSIFDGGRDGQSFDAGVTDATLGDSSNPFGDSGPVTALTIQPANPTVPVTITSGVISSTPVTFTAIDNDNVQVAASFSLDRGELGNIDPSTGVFTASGNLPGVGNITATYYGAMSADGGPLVATTTVTVTIAMTQNGKPIASPDAGTDGGSTLGGNNGVGGNDYGNPVTTTIQTLLDGPATPPANAAELGFLYPYDQTVWPQGILAPLLQWQSTHASATIAVKIHLAEKGFTFDGYYTAPGWVNEPIDETGWSDALYGNQGDTLEADVYITDGTTVWGPITEHWVVANGVLQGTVYYNSYNSEFTSSANGAVLAIQPGALAPSLAVPGTSTACHVCHEVSSDGSTIIVTSGDYTTTTAYDLTNNGSVIKTYTGGTNAPDGTNNNAKFVWSAMYPDGTFAMTDGNNSREGPWYRGNDQNSDLYRRSDGSKVTYGGAITETGWTNTVTDALEPSFSPDGKHITFDFWGGAGNGTVNAGSGHSLAVMDFDCGQGTLDGGAATTCGSSTYAFSNLRQLYDNGSRYVGWPGFTPDSNGIIFHNTVTMGTGSNDYTTTWDGAQAELWYTDLGTTPQPLRMNWLNGLNGSSTSYLPTNTNHPNDTILNYEPTVNPIASGGYFWVVFTTRRMYGNVAEGAPYDDGNGTYPIPKKLWVAAIDINPTPGTDPSHPAFYLPGQELNAGNLRGFWVVNPCQQNGTSCTQGDQCCNGFCRQGPDAGGLVCGGNPGGCSQIYEACTTTADGGSSDCCGTLACINGHCAQAIPN